MASYEQEFQGYRSYSAHETRCLSCASADSEVDSNASERFARKMRTSRPTAKVSSKMCFKISVPNRAKVSEKTDILLF